MNALNIISSIGTIPGTPNRSRKSSITQSTEKLYDGDNDSDHLSVADKSDDENNADSSGGEQEIIPLLKNEHDYHSTKIPSIQQPSKWTLLPKKIIAGLLASFRFIINTIIAPIIYIFNFFYDFSIIPPIRKLYSKRKTLRSTSKIKNDDKRSKRNQVDIYTAASAAEDDGTKFDNEEKSNQTNSSRDDIIQDENTPRRSMRIKIQSDLISQKKQKLQNDNDNDEENIEEKIETVANTLKSPSNLTISTTNTKLKYPRIPTYPRPLIPKRQLSYSNIYNNSHLPKKTLILDLDETLIHSMAKGGRMSSGHMVEVKFQRPITSGRMILGPQIPILYFVHERPYCHEFLKKVCKWFNLIIFTASVQEYADPVIDWLERERPYFTGRYYRQHCTFRNGAYIKDLTRVEPDLSKVMILDNSPMSYIFHEDNAIPIEGWISDPTDNDLLHLLPFLEGLQYVTDVRALLALRIGQT